MVPVSSGSSWLRRPWRRTTIRDFWGWFRSVLYDRLILHMTIGWYEIVLHDLDAGSRLLDVGVGTAGALVACHQLVRAKQLQVVGMDYDDHYIRQAETAIARADLADQIKVVAMDLYQLEEHALALSCSAQETTFDAAYFSGSFSLLPDWPAALTRAAAVLKPGGKIYITQTYQTQASWLWSWMKPWLRHVTTIDFGQLVTTDRIESFYQSVLADKKDWKLLGHEKIPRNVDNPWQAAYWTCFQIAGGAS
jgi:ubiquinone/menaquinone biosynthesis C-methylase UbiE